MVEVLEVVVLIEAFDLFHRVSREEPIAVGERALTPARAIELLRNLGIAELPRRLVEEVEPDGVALDEDSVEIEEDGTRFLLGLLP